MSHTAQCVFSLQMIYMTPLMLLTIRCRLARYYTDKAYCAVCRILHDIVIVCAWCIVYSVHIPVLHSVLPWAIVSL
jgi:hypothetical protein